MTASPISQFKVRSRVAHMAYGGGKVVLREGETVGIVWDTGLKGAYGRAFWERFPSVIQLAEEQPGELAEPSPISEQMRQLESSQPEGA